MTEELPAAFAAIREDFLALTVADRLQLLLEFANGLPPLPAEYARRPELLEPVYGIGIERIELGGQGHLLFGSPTV